MGHKPLYRQIADRIREQIARGELKPGDALPTESALQTEFGVSRVTVRQALRQLVEQQNPRKHSGQRDLRQRRAGQLRYFSVNQF
ncbi:GntR family transcriptional regulator [Escherichia coli]|uniref:GntR family transcriptional regulator n=1 Tax=Escherichia coli TaxID=562 RepID=UPI003D6482C1